MPGRAQDGHETAGWGGGAEEYARGGPPLSAPCERTAPSLYAGSDTTTEEPRPSTLSTWIVPPCPFTTMSWAIESPRPVPSPGAFVVKNGSNARAHTSGRHPDPVVLYPDLDPAGRPTGRDRHRRAVRPTGLVRPLPHGVEPVPHEGDDDPPDLRRDDIGLPRRRVEVEDDDGGGPRVLPAVVLREPDVLPDDRVEVGRRPRARSDAAVVHHRTDDGVGPGAVLLDLLRVLREVGQQGLRLGAFPGVQRHAEVAGELTREGGEVGDEVEGVLDLVGDAGRERTEAGHRLLVHEAGLRGLEVGKRPLELDRPPDHLLLELAVPLPQRVEERVALRLLLVGEGEVEVGEEPPAAPPLDHRRAAQLEDVGRFSDVDRVLDLPLDQGHVGAECAGVRRGDVGRARGGVPLPLVPEGLGERRPARIEVARPGPHPREVVGDVGEDGIDGVGAGLLPSAEECLDGGQGLGFSLP